MWWGTGRPGTCGSLRAAGKGGAGEGEKGALKSAAEGGGGGEMKQTKGVGSRQGEEEDWMPRGGTAGGGAGPADSEGAGVSQGGMHCTRSSTLAPVVVGCWQRTRHRHIGAAQGHLLLQNPGQGSDPLVCDSISTLQQWNAYSRCTAMAAPIARAGTVSDPAGPAARWHAHTAAAHARLAGLLHSLARAPPQKPPPSGSHGASCRKIDTREGALEPLRVIRT